MDAIAWEKIKRQCPSLPWCQDEPEQISRAVIQHLVDQETYFNQWAWRWYQNMQFVFGNHFVKWSRQYGFAVDADFLSGSRRAINVKSYTNITSTIAESLSAAIYFGLPSWEVLAMDDSSSLCSRYKKISQKILDAHMELMDMQEEFRAAAAAYVIYGQIASVVDWDLSSGKLLDIPVFVNKKTGVYKTSLGRDPMLGTIVSNVSNVTGYDDKPWLQDSWVPAVDENGKPRTKKITLGSPRIKFLTPFEYRREPGSSGMHTTKYVQWLRMMDYDDYYREYSNLDGKQEAFNKVEPENMSKYLQSFAMRHFIRLFQVNPSYETNFRQSGYGFGDYMRKKMLVIEHYDKPCEQWPEGRRVVIANGHCTHVTKPQYSTNKAGGWHPFSEAQWFKVAPSAIGRGPLHDVVEKNRQLNTSDSLVATALQRNMGSKLLIKSGSGLDPQQITGTPGEIIECADPFGSANYLHDSQPIPSVVNDLREQYKNDVYEESGAGDAIRGERSPNASSGYAHRLIQEREEKRITPNAKSFEKIISSTGEKLLYCLKQNCVQLGEDVIGYLKTHSSGQFTVQDVLSFMEGDYHIGSEIRVASGSMTFKSKATKQANLQELAKGQLGNRLAQDANVMDKYLKEFEVEGLRDRSASHRDRATRENELFEDLLRLGPDGKTETMPVVLVEDDHDIHISEHTDWMLKNDSDLMRTKWLMQSLMLHIEMHRIQKKELQGDIPIGAANLVGKIAPMASTPDVNQVVQEKQQMDQRKQQEAKIQASPGARLPAQPGSKGGTQEATGTPAANTQTGRQQV